jgi:hypothetical protein
VEAGSPLGVESHLGQVPLQRTRHVLMPHPIILAENPDGSVLAHTKGREGNRPVGTQI